MPPLSTLDTPRITATRQSHCRVQPDYIVYDGSGLNVDYAGYLAQHDVVYHAPAVEGAHGMPIGDGDIGAMLSCPDLLRFQIQKSDLWADPSTTSGSPSDWRQASAGSVSVVSEPSFIQNHVQYQQRLSLNAGIVTVNSENAHGACQMTAFMSATAGVLVIRYRDQSVRGTQRRVDVALQRHGAHVFALGETIGVLQALQDRRYALLARVVGAGTNAKRENAFCASLFMDSTRTSEFTVYVAVATSPRNGDPVAVARSRIEAAIASGYDQLLAEQRQHWSAFWEKSFLRLQSPKGDALPSYLENLWYLTMYQQACCSRGYDAPLANGALWLGGEDCRCGPAVYAGSELRALLAGLMPSNHLELSVPYVDTYFRLLPQLAARTGSENGMPGARLPTHFNRFGDDLSDSAGMAGEGPSTGPTSPQDAGQLLGEGLETGLLVWEAWRHAPDTFFLRERAYPLLRASTEFAVERLRSVPELWKDSKTRSLVAAALRALLWAEEEYGLGDENRSEWERVWNTLKSDSAPYRILELQPFGPLKPAESSRVFGSLINSIQQQPCGLFGVHKGSPDLAFSARLCAGLSGILLSERPLFTNQQSEPSAAAPAADGFGGAAPAAIEVFSGLPAAWSGAFSLIAPGGFRVSAEAIEGRTRYIAIKSLLGGRCRLINPWGPAERARILQGRTPLFDVAGPVLEFMTQPNTCYLVEQYDLPLSRSVMMRLGGKANTTPKQCGDRRIGIPAAGHSAPRGVPPSRLPVSEPGAGVANTVSRVERARELARAAR